MRGQAQDGDDRLREPHARRHAVRRAHPEKVRIRGCLDGFGIGVRVADMGLVFGSGGYFNIFIYLHVSG